MLTTAPTVTIAIIALLGTLALPCRAQANDAEELQARALFKRAEVHFSAREFQQALELYSQAHKIRALPGFLFNIAQCHRHLGRCKEAVGYYRTYLRRLPDAPNRTDVEQLIAECEAVTRIPEYVHGKDSGKGTRRGVHRAWFWSGLALSGALLATGAVCGALNLTMSSEYQDLSTSVERRRELKDTGPTLGVISGVTLGLGGAAVVGTTLLFFYTDFGSPGVAFSPTSSGGMMMVEGRF